MMTATDPILTAEELAALDPNAFNTYENKVRRAAKRQGLEFVKSRTRDPRALDYGRHQLVDGRGTVVHECRDLTGIAQYLWGPR